VDLRATLPPRERGSISDVAAVDRELPLLGSRE
jgi:hypothetical protein